MARQQGCSRWAGLALRTQPRQDGAGKPLLPRGSKFRPCASSSPPIRKEPWCRGLLCIPCSVSDTGGGVYIIRWGNRKMGSSPDKNLPIFQSCPIWVFHDDKPVFPSAAMCAGNDRCEHGRQGDMAALLAMPHGIQGGKLRCAAHIALLGKPAELTVLLAACAWCIDHAPTEVRHARQALLALATGGYERASNALYPPVALAYPLLSL